MDSAAGEQDRRASGQLDPELEEYLDAIPSARIRLRDALQMGRFVAAFLGPYRGRAALVCALLLVDAALDLCFPIASRWLVDDGLIGRNGFVVAVVLG